MGSKVGIRLCTCVGSKLGFLVINLEVGYVDGAEETAPGPNDGVTVRVGLGATEGVGTGAKETGRIQFGGPIG